MRKAVAFIGAALSGLLGGVEMATAETTECTQITSLPSVISAEGVYCLKSHLATSITVGKAIDITANNVTIDFNGFKLGGLGGGPATQATGIAVNLGIRNATIRNASVRGFRVGLSTTGIATTIEDNSFDSATQTAVYLGGDNHIVRRNSISRTGTTGASHTVYGIWAAGLSDTLIEDNHLTQLGLDANSQVRALNMQNAMRIILRGNSVVNFGNSNVTPTAITFGSDVSGNIVEGNRVVLSPSAAAIGYGIYFGAGSTLNSCIDNVIVGFPQTQFNCALDLNNHSLD